MKFETYLLPLSYSQLDKIDIYRFQTLDLINS